VSGGVGGAAAGTLTFMVGGGDAAFARPKPLFDIMGQKAVHCGPAGNGQAAKICNNMILGVTMIATCEAFALADKLGLDRQAMFDVVSTSSGYSWTMNAYCPAPGVGPTSPADNDYKPGFAADLMLKDLRLSQEAAIAADADTPMGAAAAALYEKFVEEEDGSGRIFPRCCRGLSGADGPGDAGRTPSSLRIFLDRRTKCVTLRIDTPRFVRSQPSARKMTAKVHLVAQHWAADPQDGTFDWNVLTPFRRGFFLRIKALRP
jgi:hypothetical protein